MARWLIFSLFACLTMVGTFLHEAGHYIAGVLLGYRPMLHYNRTEINVQVTRSGLNEWVDAFIQSTAGPFVNMLIGSAAFVFLLKNYKRLSERQIVAYAAIAFFWSREIVVAIIDLTGMHLFSGIVYSDEQHMSMICGMPENLFSLLFGGIAICALGWVTFLIVPANARMRFILLGGTGCVAGYFLWFRLLGPVVLP